MRRQSENSYYLARQDAAELAHQAHYYQSHQQPSQPTLAQRRRGHRDRATGSAMPVVQQYYQPGPSLILPRPRDPATEANDIIDLMCALSPHEAFNLEWILDLEYGPPHSRPPAHRHIAYYDPAKRIVMSASQPNTVHPDFLRCNERFRDMLVEQYIRRDVQAAQAQPAPPPPPPPQQVPYGYHELYRMMEEQKNMQNALMAASARQSYNSRPHM